MKCDMQSISVSIEAIMFTLKVSFERFSNECRLKVYIPLVGEQKCCGDETAAEKASAH
jgi:hypothetical protein